MAIDGLNEARLAVSRGETRLKLFHFQERVDPPRVLRRDLQRDLASESAEVLGPGHEVRLGVHLDEHPDAALAMDVRVD